MNRVLPSYISVLMVTKSLGSPYCLSRIPFGASAEVYRSKIYNNFIRETDAMGIGFLSILNRYSIVSIYCFY